jgi:hypothetical protein
MTQAPAQFQHTFLALVLRYRARHFRRRLPLSTLASERIPLCVMHEALHQEQERYLREQKPLTIEPSDPDPQLCGVRFEIANHRPCGLCTLDEEGIV